MQKTEKTTEKNRFLSKNLYKKLKNIKKTLYFLLKICYNIERICYT